MENILGADLVTKAKDEINEEITDKKLKVIKHKLNGIKEREIIIQKYIKKNATFEDDIAKVVSMTNEEFLSDELKNDY